jgi:hypothetical protein
MKREYDLSKGKRRPFMLPREKIRIAIRLGRNVVDHFRDRVRSGAAGQLSDSEQLRAAGASATSDPCSADKRRSQMPFARSGREEQGERINKFGTPASASFGLA